MGTNLSAPIMFANIEVSHPLENEPELARLIGCISGHSSLISTTMVGIFGLTNNDLETQKYARAPAKKKRQQLKKCVQESSVERYFCDQIKACLDEVITPLETKRGRIMHEVWTPDTDKGFKLMDNQILVGKKLSTFSITEESLSCLLNEDKSANGSLLSFFARFSLALKTGAR